VLAGKAEPGKEALAGKSTLNRMELGDGTPNRYKKITFWRDAIDDLLVDVFLEARSARANCAGYRHPPILRSTASKKGAFITATTITTAICRCMCLPASICCARACGPAISIRRAGSRKEIERIVKQIRAAWPEVQIVLRGDSGFCREELMAWCENNQVDYVFGLARNVRLEAIVAEALQEARRQWEQTQQPARVFTEFQHETVSGTWSRKRRVVAKAEHIDGKSNPRFIVTSLLEEDWAARPLYEDLYCARGDMENRIKEQFVLFADRVSAASMRANQLRLYLSVMAYSLVCGLRRAGLRATHLANAQVGTIRVRLLKIGAQIRVTVRKIWIQMSSSFPLQTLFRHALQQLRC
jgi:hypothetical protein